MPRSRDIYVEISIRGSMEALWRMTQTPELHERWDARFSTIEYLPRPNEDEPQRFRYATRIGFGKRIEGAGESVGEHHEESGGRTSALRFWSDDSKSLIRDGSGFWKYIPIDDPGDRGDADCEGSVRFLTRYDYRTRFGVLGAMVDRVLFRPLLAWATAWSFDCLRLWIENSIPPEVSIQRSLIHAISRLSLAILWLYQGIVPKLLFRDLSGELDTVRSSGLFDGIEHPVLTIAAVIEIVFGLLLIILWRSRRLLMINVVAMIFLALVVLASNANLFVMQFNPATLNLAMAAIGLTGWLSGRELPSAANCLRSPPELRA